MAIIHNEIGCLTAIKSILAEHRISGFDSLLDITTFQRDYVSKRQNIILNHTRIIEQEKSKLHKEIPELNNLIRQREKPIEQQLAIRIERLKNKLLNSSPNKNKLLAIVSFLYKEFIKVNIWLNKVIFNWKISISTSRLTREVSEKSKRYLFIDLHVDDAINESSSAELQKIDYTKKILDQENNSIIGAVGEQLAVKELEYLSDEYIVINDFTLSFDYPIYHPQEKSYIKSIQLDHILVSTSGIFIIETKNWSENSIKNLSLHSPVSQIKRANYALYKILSGEISAGRLWLKKHHWGNKKIPNRNIILMINQKPKEEFQYVKILTLGQLLNYIGYFEPIFNNQEVQHIATYLLSICGKRLKSSSSG